MFDLKKSMERYQDYMKTLGMPCNTKQAEIFFKDLIEGISKKDYDCLSSRLHTANKYSRRCFNEYTGLTLPSTNQETYEFLKDFCGREETEKHLKEQEEEQKTKKEKEIREYFYNKYSSENIPSLVSCFEYYKPKTETEVNKIFKDLVSVVSYEGDVLCLYQVLNRIIENSKECYLEKRGLKYYLVNDGKSIYVKGGAYKYTKFKLSK